MIGNPFNGIERVLASNSFPFSFFLGIHSMELKDATPAPTAGLACGEKGNPFNGIERLFRRQGRTIVFLHLWNPFNGIERGTCQAHAPSTPSTHFESIQWN